MAKNRKQTVELELEGQFGNYEAWTSPMYSEVRGVKGNVVKRFRGTFSGSDAIAEAEDLSRVLSLV